MTANILTHKFNSFTSWTDHISSRVSSHEARKNKTALKNTSQTLGYMNFIESEVQDRFQFKPNESLYFTVLQLKVEDTINMDKDCINFQKEHY